MKFSLLPLILLPVALTAPVTTDYLAAVLFPNYIVPIKQATPYTAYPTQYTGQISYTSSWHKDEIRLLVGFDVPEDVGTRCAIKFTLAPKTSPYGYQWTVNGSGKLDVWKLAGLIESGETTWANKPARTTKEPLFTIAQPKNGGDALVGGSVIPCKAGQRMDFEIAGTRPTSVFFDWFELDNPKTGITLHMYT